MGNHPNRGKKTESSNPTPTEIVELRQKHGLTQAAAGELWLSSLRTVQGWESPIGTEANRRCHPLMWWAMKKRCEEYGNQANTDIKTDKGERGN